MLLKLNYERGYMCGCVHVMQRSAVQVEIYYTDCIVKPEVADTMLC